MSNVRNVPQEEVRPPRSQLFYYAYMSFHAEYYPWDIQRLEEAVQREYITRLEFHDIIAGIR